MTIAFKSYVLNLEDTDFQDNLVRMQNDKLPKGCRTYSGRTIFEILSKGTETEITSVKDQGNKTINLTKDFETEWAPAFLHTLSDIALLQNDQNAKTSIENFFDSLKKILRLKRKLEKEKVNIGYEVEEEEKENHTHVLNRGPSPLKKDKPKSSMVLGEDIDDYFVFIYDEEEKGMHQAKMKRSGGFGAATTRIIGFWCFNPGIGFREIQELNPRSIILTSGTLAPLESF